MRSPTRAAVDSASTTARRADCLGATRLAARDREEHDRPPRRADRTDRVTLRSPTRRCSNRMRCSAATTRWSPTSGLRCRRRCPSATAWSSSRCSRLLRHRGLLCAIRTARWRLLGTFCHANPSALHRADGAGVAFWADRVLTRLDAINPRRSPRAWHARRPLDPPSEPYRRCRRTRALARRGRPACQRRRRDRRPRARRHDPPEPHGGRPSRKQDTMATKKRTRSTPSRAASPR